jgi:hypothetical protein
LVGSGQVLEHPTDFSHYWEVQGATPQQIEELESALSSSGIEGFWSWHLGVLNEEEPLSGWQRLRLVDALAQLDRTDEAFAVLETAFEEHEGWMIYIGVWPFLDPLRSDPRFDDLRRRIGLPQ